MSDHHKTREQLIDELADLRRQIVALEDRAPLGDASSLADGANGQFAGAGSPANEDCYRLLADHTNDIVSLQDCAGRHLFISPSYYRLTGWTTDDVKQTDWSTRQHPDDLEHVKRALAENLTGKSNVIEHRVRRRDGSWLWLERHGIPIFGPFGEVWRVLLRGHDITARKEAQTALQEAHNELRRRGEEALRESEERFATIFRASPVGFGISRLADGSFVAVNDWFCRLFGYVREEILGRSALELGLWANTDERAKVVALLREHGRIEHFEARFRRKSGELGDALFSADLIDLNGQPHILGILTDITERKRTEAALRDSEERYRGLFEAESDAIFVGDCETGSIIDANQAALDLYGYRRDEYLTLRATDLSAEPKRTMESIVNREVRIPFIRHRKKDGTVFPVEIVRSYFTYHGHQVHVAAVRDITERVRTEGALRASEERYRLLVEELKQAQEVLKQVYDEQLQRHQAELAHVARLSIMGEMAASLAHELNQPLYAVKNYAYGGICRLRETIPQDKELIDVLEQINEEAGRAAEIIRRVKEFLQKRKASFTKVEVNRLVEEAIRFSRMEIARHRTKIAFDLEDGLPPVSADPIQIEQVIINLIRNALEAMEQTPEYRRTLSLKTIYHDETNLEVVVSDRGNGFSETDSEKMFEPFFTTKPEGLGMGLAISRSIIQSHNGRLWATVNPHGGSTFHFTLPLDRRTNK